MSFILSYLGIPFCLFLLYVLVLLGLNLKQNTQKITKETYQNRWIFGAELLFTVLAPLIGFLRYSETGFSPEFPFAEKHLLTLIVLVAIAVIGYWLSRLYKTKLPPLLDAFVPVMVLQGFLLNIILVIHFGGHILMGAIFPLIGFELIAPFVNIVLFGRELFYHHLAFQQIREHTQIYHHNRILRFLENTHFPVKTGLNFILLFPFLFLQQFILTLFGQVPDAAIRVFVETCKFTFSGDGYCPPPAGHYLCSVAAHGNSKLVKPIRRGQRGNSLIVVNRQLLIANAFEQWLEDYAPKTHRKLRSFYDSLKIPVDKWAENKHLANVLYVLMKPLEWFFLLWLYALDSKPENRIATQYLPQKLKK